MDKNVAMRLLKATALKVHNMYNDVEIVEDEDYTVVYKFHLTYGTRKSDPHYIMGFNLVG